MKLKQDLIIRQYFIDYSLGKYSEDKNPTVPEYLVEELSKPNYEENLEITKLVVSETNVDASFKSSKVVANNQVYDFSKPNEIDLFEAKYLDSATYPTVKDIPMDIVDDLVLVEDMEGRKPVIFVNKEFKKLDPGEKFKHVIEIFKNRVRVDYSEPEVILGQTFDLDKDSSWDEELEQLVIVSAVLKGRICIVDDVRRYELQDAHIGKLTHDNNDELAPIYGNFKVKTTNGEILELDLTDKEAVAKWIEDDWIEVSTTSPISEEENQPPQLVITMKDVSEVVSWGGEHIHLTDEVVDLKGYRLPLPELVKIPDYLPEWAVNLNGFLAEASIFNQSLDHLDFSNVIRMDGFLLGAGKFNQPLNLNTSNVTSMFMFLAAAVSFNSEINLDTSKVTNMGYFFYNASSFNQPLNLNTSNVTNMEMFLTGAENFDSEINLDTSNVTNMEGFLGQASSFNQPLNLDTSNVTNMSMFLGLASSFNQPINLDTSKVSNMQGFLFRASSFNQPLNLDTSNVTNMSMFLNEATSFNQDLSHLCVPLIKEEPIGFAVGAAAYTKPRPIWGTCPGKE